MDIDQTASKSYLLSIPLDILLQITSTANLRTSEYGNLRLTCKGIEHALLNTFAREFFTKRQFMLTHFSLQALIDISKSRLGKYIQHVIIGLEQPSINDAKMVADMYSGKQLAPDNCLLQEYIEHLALLNTGQDFEMLTEAFSNLSNLDTIGIRDFSSRSRNRDWPQNTWRSYGATTLEQKARRLLSVPPFFRSQPPPDAMSVCNYLSRIFLNLFRALGRAGSTIKNFEVILRHYGLTDNAFCVPKYTECDVFPALDNIRTLFLDLSPQFPPHLLNIDGTPTPCINYFLPEFLSKVTKLEYLRLNFKSYTRSCHKDVLLWLSTDVCTTSSTLDSALNGVLQPPHPKLPPPVSFSYLRQLDIGMAFLDADVLVAIFRKYRSTLRAISLHKASLIEPKSVMTRTQVNLWSKFLGQLSKLDLKLDFINMSMLNQCSSGQKAFRSITFKGTPNPRAKKWAGTNTQSGLRDFINDIELEKINSDSETSNDDQSNEYESSSPSLLSNDDEEDLED